MKYHNRDVFLTMYRDLLAGRKVSPRGSNVLECEDYMFKLDMSESVLTSFRARSLNLKYAKAEFVWYLRGDPYDTFIEQYASMWPKIKQDGGFYYSNYGKYLFTDGQVLWIIEELARDKDSRRASAVLLNASHLFGDNRDLVCTYSLNFRIRNDRLNMSVNMRSNDAIFGTTNDVFAFAMVYEIVFGYLRHSTYPFLGRGFYAHKVDSLHVYERHWPMLAQLVQERADGYEYIPTPEIMSKPEADGMLRICTGEFNPHVVTSQWELLSWLYSDLA